MLGNIYCFNYWFELNKNNFKISFLLLISFFKQNKLIRITFILDLLKNILKFLLKEQFCFWSYLNCHHFINECFLRNLQLLKWTNFKMDKGNFLFFLKLGLKIVLALFWESFQNNKNSNYFPFLKEKNQLFMSINNFRDY